VTRAETVLPLPGGARVAASFSFDVDGESAALATDENLGASMSAMSHQAYGPLVGVTRILQILESHGMKSTFFVPGYTAVRYPDVVSYLGGRRSRDCAPRLSPRHAHGSVGRATD